MKEIFDSDRIPHLWMHKQQDYARNAGGNLYLRGDTIYSYGSHFPIARHIERRGKGPAILLTTCGYSNTTAKQIGMVRGAIPSSATIFHVALSDKWTATKDGPAAIKAYKARIAEHQLRAARAREDHSRNYELRCALTAHRELEAFITYFGIRRKLEPLEVDLDAIKVAAEADKKREAAKAKRKAAVLRKTYAVEIDAWLNNAQNSFPAAAHVDTLLRIRGDEVETSMGAFFPLSHARRGLLLVESVMASKKPWKSNGHTCHLGHYQIESIDTNGTVHAGCHHVKYEAIERIRPQILAAAAEPATE